MQYEKGRKCLQLFVEGKIMYVENPKISRYITGINDLAKLMDLKY